MHKSLLILLVLGFAFCAAAATLYAKTVPTPELAIQFDLRKDAKKWAPKFLDGNETSILQEWVPEGETVEAWNEMVAFQIAFTKVAHKRVVEIWTERLKRADPQVDVYQTSLDDGSIVVTYTSMAAKEVSIRRFLQGSDGVYMLAYHVRPNVKTEQQMELWREIINGASLVPNPELKSKPKQ